MRLPLLILAALSFSLLSLTQAQAVPTAEDATLEGLVGRLLGADAGYTLHVAEAPAGLLEHVPVPDWARYYGAMVGEQESTVVLSLEDERSPAAFMDLIPDYEALLEAGGWRGVLIARHEPVFVQPDTLYDSRARPDLYCHDESGRTLQLSPVFAQERLTGLRLHLDARFAQQLCSGEEAPFSVRPLPTLVLPEGVNLQGSSSGAGGGYAEASVTFATELSRERMLEHLAAQLVEAGWERQDEASLDSHLLLAFSFEEGGESWQGLLTVMGDEGGTRAVILRIHSLAWPQPAAAPEAVSVAYERQALLLLSPRGVAVVAFTPEPEDGASYRYRLLRQGAEEEEQGEGRLFEKYRSEPNPDGQGFRLTDLGSQLMLTAGPLRVEWSRQSPDAGWIYQDGSVEVSVVDRGAFETLDLRAHSRP